MSWRNFETHYQETKKVKEALLKAGYPVLSVGHGSGTAWGWLEIRLCPPKQGEDWWERNRQVISLAKSITGRTGDYDGEILVS